MSPVPEIVMSDGSGVSTMNDFWDTEEAAHQSNEDGGSRLQYLDTISRNMCHDAFAGRMPQQPWRSRGVDVGEPGSSYPTSSLPSSETWTFSQSRDVSGIPKGSIRQDGQNDSQDDIAFSDTTSQTASSSGGQYSMPLSHTNYSDGRGYFSPSISTPSTVAASIDQGPGPTSKGHFGDTDFHSRKRQKSSKSPNRPSDSNPESESGNIREGIETTVKSDFLELLVGKVSSLLAGTVLQAARDVERMKSVHDQAIHQAYCLGRQSIVGNASSAHLASLDRLTTEQESVRANVKALILSHQFQNDTEIQRNNQPAPGHDNRNSWQGSSCPSTYVSPKKGDSTWNSSKTSEVDAELMGDNNSRRQSRKIRNATISSERQCGIPHTAARKSKLSTSTGAGQPSDTAKRLNDHDCATKSNPATLENLIAILTRLGSSGGSFGFPSGIHDIQVNGQHDTRDAAQDQTRQISERDLLSTLQSLAGRRRGSMQDYEVYQDKQDIWKSLQNLGNQAVSGYGNTPHAPHNLDNGGSDDSDISEQDAEESHHRTDRAHDVNKHDGSSRTRRRRYH